MKPMILNRTSVVSSIRWATGFPRSPISDRAAPNSTAITSTWRMSPSAKAPTNVDGMTFMRKPTAPSMCSARSV